MMAAQIAILVLCLLSSIIAAAQQSYSEFYLDGPDWTLTSTNETIGKLLDCKVPGDNFGALMQHHVVGEPFYRYGDLNYRWAAFHNWTYTKIYPLPCNNGVCDYPFVELTLLGVQVVSDVFVNDVRVGETRDQFQRYTFDITKIIRDEWRKHPNVRSISLNVTVAIMSSVLYGAAQAAAYKLDPPSENRYLVGFWNRNFVRTEQSSFGWDWGPAFAPVGISDSVIVRVYSPPHPSVQQASGRIDLVVPHIFPLPFNRTVAFPLSDTRNDFLLRFVVFAVGVRCKGSSLQVRVDAPTMHGSTNVSEVKAGDNDGETVQLTVELYVHDVPLWWPAGYGKQTRHPINVQLTARSSNESFILDANSFPLGVRSVELMTHNDPLNHSATPARPLPVMYFAVNGIPMYIKGANLIPFDAFLSRVNRTVMETVLDSAVDANMNMVRVWGGGIFPADEFYDMCDEKGLMAWQEMIFACAEYPIDSPFLALVRSEIRYQIRRTSRFSSIVMWSGNNENEEYDHGPGSPYQILDYDNVLQTIIEEDTSRPIWPSSPSHGFVSGVTPSGLPAGTQERPMPFTVGGDSGDAHYYNYFTCPNITVYPKTNFASEFGFQSLPWFENFAPVSDPNDWSLFSSMMEHRQHHPGGNEEISKLLHQNFKVNFDLNDTSLSIFKRAIYLSQLQQVLCIQNEAAFYRRGRDMPYRTMGTLYWQLNQNWQAPSWTSLEYGGDWKILHYAMAEVYHPLFLSAFFDPRTGIITAHVASDLLQATPSRIQLLLVPFGATAPSSFAVLFNTTVVVPPQRGVFFANFSRHELLEANKAMCPSPDHCFVKMSIAGMDGKPLAPDQPLWLSDYGSMKTAELNPKVTVTAKVIGVTPTQATIDVSANGVALYVMVRTQIVPGHFSRNSYVLYPGETRRVIFYARKGFSIHCDTATFERSLVIQHLNNEQ